MAAECALYLDARAPSAASGFLIEVIQCQNYNPYCLLDTSKLLSNKYRINSLV